MTHSAKLLRSLALAVGLLSSIPANAFVPMAPVPVRHPLPPAKRVTGWISLYAGMESFIYRDGIPVFCVQTDGGTFWRTPDCTTWTPDALKVLQRRAPQLFKNGKSATVVSFQPGYYDNQIIIFYDEGTGQGAAPSVLPVSAAVK